MGGGVMQLVAYGAQDIYITGNPQITFYKIVYKRTTNFAIESIKQSFVNLPELGKKSTCIISKNGDLIQQMYFEITLPLGLSDITEPYPPLSWWTNGVGNAMISSVELQIGGSTIDIQYGQWMDIWTELTNKPEQRVNYDNMVGNYINTTNNYGIPTNAALGNRRLFVPLQFWFNRNPGLALPIVALTQHEVRLNLELRSLAELYVGIFTQSTSLSTDAFKLDLYVDYIFLDTDERRKFAQSSHEYLIEQVQKSRDLEIEAGTKQILAPIKFYHPVKEIIWVIPNLDFNTAGNSAGGYYNRWLDYSNNKSKIINAPNDTFETATIEMNGSPRFYKRYANYFRLVQNYQRHTNSPRVPNVSAFNGNIYCKQYDSEAFPEYYNTNKYIYTYSFSLSPEDHQPSGTCNFSKLNSVNLSLTFATGNIDEFGALLMIFGVNYNVLRVFNGQAGLAYSN
jgi:hypothetical protein